MARVLRTGETSRNEFTRYTRDDGTGKTETQHTHIEQEMVRRSSSSPACIPN